MWLGGNEEDYLSVIEISFPYSNNITLKGAGGGGNQQRITKVYIYVVVCTDLWGKEPHRQVGVGDMVTSGSLRGVMVITLLRHARDVG